MRVLFVYKYLTVGGVPTVLRARLEGLPTLGIEPAAWFFYDLGGAPLFAEVRERVHLGGPDACAAFARRGGFDLLCAIDTEEVLDGRLEGSGRPRLVVECHSTYPADLGYLARLDGDVRALLVPSRAHGDFVRRHLRHDLDIRVVPNPLRDVFVATPAPFPTPPSRPVVAWIGRMDPLKNWKGFLALGGALLESGCDTELWLVGRQAFPAAEVWQHVAAAGVAPRLRWFAGVPHPRVPALLDAVRDSGGVLVSTSEAESFGMTVAEAMARGCAVAVPAHPALVELAEAERTGVTFPPGATPEAAAAVRRLLDDDEFRRRVAAAGRELVLERFAPAVALPRLAAELRALSVP